MKTQFFFMPDAAANGGDAIVVAAVPHTPVRHISTVPTNDADLVSVSNAVAAKWLGETWFTMKYKSQTDFAAEVATYANLVQARTAAGGGSHGLTTDLAILDKEADDALPYVKNYVFNKYGPKHAADYYGIFGIEHRHGAYELPRERHKRQIAIQTMIDGLHKSNWDTETYGTNWWKALQTKYNAALASAEGNSSDISGFVGELSMLRTSLRRTLHSVLLILEGNYNTPSFSDR